MNNTLSGRIEDVEIIKKYAESSVVGNQAFLGVKGVGKTTLFRSYFTRKKRGELSTEFKKLFVFSQLDSRKSGSDLYKFMLEWVKSAIVEIPDQDVRNEIRFQMREIDEIFETPDGRLNQYLNCIKESGYDLIVIMDHFHCMARDGEIGKEQYDVLRSFHEQKLITYWIITDTDLMETCATEQYIDSFFAQKFTSKITIKPLKKEHRIVALESFVTEKKIALSEAEMDLVADVSGGIPELMSMLVDILNLLKNEGKLVSADMLLEAAITHKGCASLFDGWVSGLNSNQKKILFEVACSDMGIDKAHLTMLESRMAELADEVGRGLLHVEKNSDGKTWTINTEIFRKFISSNGTAFYHQDEKPGPSNEVVSRESHVTNVYHIAGNFIQSQTNNVLNVENAVAGLEDLQRLVRSNSVLLDESQVAGKLDYLPFKQDVWLEMDETEQEEELGKYADGIFSSETFSKNILTSEQMRAFCLSEELLGNLSEKCRKQIICGVQVYDLIQRCIDQFGLCMSESESPRGILFARAFELHLQDFAAPAFCRIPELASHSVYPTTKAFKDFELDKTTIGTYSAILNDGYPIFAQVSTQLLGRSDRGTGWWRQLTDRLRKIGSLRNECCHSGAAFDYAKLSELIERMFMQKSLEDILIFSEIPTLQSNQFGQSQMTYRPPIATLIGQTVPFRILSKGNNGNFKGIIDEKYEGSLPKRFAMTMNYVSVKGTVITVHIDKIQDGKYVLSC